MCLGVGSKDVNVQKMAAMNTVPAVPNTPTTCSEPTEELNALLDQDISDSDAAKIVQTLFDTNGADAIVVTRAPPAIKDTHRLGKTNGSGGGSAGLMSGTVPRTLADALLAASVEGGRDSAARLCLRHGARLNVPMRAHGHLDETILHFACIRESCDTGIQLEGIKSAATVTVTDPEPVAEPEPEPEPALELRESVAATWARLLLTEATKVRKDRADALKEPNRLGYCALELACQRRDVDCVRILLDEGANPNAQKPYGMGQCQALILACEQRPVNPSIVAMLLAKWAHTFAVNGAKQSPLHVLCNSKQGTEGVIEALEMVLHHGANAMATDMDGNTPLHLACQAGNASAAKRLLTRGANINATNAARRTPLHLACARLHVDVVCELLPLRVQEEEEEEEDQHDSATDPTDAFALGDAHTQTFSVRGSAATQEVDVHSADIHGSTPALALFEFPRTTRPRRRLLVSPTTTTTTTTTTATRTPSVDDDDKRAVQILQFLAKYDPSAVSPRVRTRYDDNTLLHLASRQGYVACMRHLLHNGFPVDVRNAAGADSLLFALVTRLAGDLVTKRVLCVLLDEGRADPNGAKDRQRNSPLHVACRKNWRRCARLLHQYGGLLTARNQAGDTPLDVGRWRMTMDDFGNGNGNGDGGEDEPLPKRQRIAD